MGSEDSPQTAKACKESGITWVVSFTPGCRARGLCPELCGCGINYRNGEVENTSFNDKEKGHDEDAEGEHHKVEG